MTDSLTFDLDQLRIRAEQQAQNWDTFAKDIARGCGPLLGEASRLAFAASEILVQAAQVDAGRQAVASLAKSSTPAATVPPCRCGHDRAQHDPDQCRVCPGDEERTWKHPYTPEATDAASGDAQVRCSHPHCMTAPEWFRHAEQRGWVAWPHGAWSCPQHAVAPARTGD